MILHLIRHPRPLIEPGVCYGQLDIEAENHGALAESLRRRLPPDVPVWSSPLRRCRVLAERLHPSPSFDARLMEMNFGTWEGRPWDALPRDEIDAWAADVTDYAPPGGESAAKVLERVCDFLGERDESEIAVVTHAGVIRLLVSHLEKRPLNEVLAREVPYGELLSGYSFCHISNLD